MPQVVLAPDPDLIPHLVAHGVSIDPGQAESERVGRALLVQVRKRGLLFDITAGMLAFCSDGAWSDTPLRSIYRV